MSFPPELFRFLKDLAAHNDRAWFNANKERYETAVKGPLLGFIGDVGSDLKKISKQLVADPSPSGGSMFRIYRDTRFSKDKSPYKTHAAAHFRHAASTKDVHAPGLYLHLEPGSVFVAGGAWQPEPAVLHQIRDRIVAKPKLWEAVRKSGLVLGGESLKRPPSGYDPEHPFIEDLKRKDFISSIEFTQKDATSPKFKKQFVEACRELAPLMKFLTAAMEVPW
ncbi:MAG: TIGR02453 family protein [Myxococcota bacterium]